MSIRSPSSAVDGRAQSQGLRNLVAPDELLIGSFIEDRFLSDARYRETAAREFNLLTVGVYFWTMRPAEDVWDFSPVERVMEFARANGMKVRVHPLVWWTQLVQVPDEYWLMRHRNDPAALSHALEVHIKRVVEWFRDRYPDLVVAFDLINEPLENLGIVPRGAEIWRGVDPGDPWGYIGKAFQWAREAYPEGRFFINEIFTEANDDKFAAFLTLLRDLRLRGVRVDGVGLQGHAFGPLTVGRAVRWAGRRFGIDRAMALAASPAQLAARLAALRDAGFDVHLTEVDLPIYLPGPFHQRSLQRQGELYQGYLRACREAPNCRAFVTWGFTDAHSWIPEFFPGWGEALPFDAQYRPKPAYQGMVRALAER